MPLNVMNHTNKILSTSTTAFDVSKAHTSGIKIPGPSDPSKPAKRLVAPELMESFKTAIQGCELTKAGLVEVLKKQQVNPICENSEKAANW